LSTALRSPAVRQVGLLAACQALLLTNNVTLIAINALAGFALAADKSLATLPVTAYVLGSALSTIPASFAMKRLGRRLGFTLGGVCGIAGSLLAAYAPAEKAKTQGINDFLVYATMMASSFSSGVLVSSSGWHNLNFIAIPFVAVAALTALALALQRRRLAAATIAAG
jgi:MFS family permease